MKVGHDLYAFAGMRMWVSTNIMLTIFCFTKIAHHQNLTFYKSLVEQSNALRSHSFASSSICYIKVVVFSYHFGILSALLVKKEKHNFSKFFKLERMAQKRKKRKKSHLFRSSTFNFNGNKLLQTMEE